MKKDEFYVGYLPNAPVRIASKIRNTIGILGILICLVSLTLVTYQKQFSTATFEYGINTTVEGHILQNPFLTCPFHWG